MGILLKKVLLPALGMILGISSFVQADSLDELRKNAANIKTIQAGFVQKKQLKILTKPLFSEGKFVYVAPDSFRWEYIKPLRSVIISHQGETRRFVQTAGKMTEDKSEGIKSMNIVLGEVIHWMSGRFDHNPSFKPSVKEGANTVITLVPVGQNMAGILEKIEITIAGKSMAIKSVNIKEGESSATIINFSDVEINKAVNISVFQDVQ